jgi:hypothetical protein
MTKAKEHPILFSAPMVRALLNGSKTQTRRVVKPTPEWIGQSGVLSYRGRVGLPHALSPYGQPGDRLWVRESIFLSKETDRHHYSATGLIGPGVDYEKEPPPAIGLPAKSIPSIHMPRWASRITLEITGVRVERLQDISTTDCRAEGCVLLGQGPSVTTRDLLWSGREWASGCAWYRELWESINGPGSWDANPWVWVIEFKVVKP